MHLVNPSKIKWQDTNHGYSRKILMQQVNASDRECKVQFVKINPNTTVDPHFHKGQTESEYVLSGSGFVRSGNKVIKLRPGVLFIIERDDVHVVKAGEKGLLLFVTKANFSDDTEWCK